VSLDIGKVNQEGEDSPVQSARQPATVNVMSTVVAGEDNYNESQFQFQDRNSIA